MAASEDLALNKLMREQPEILEDALVNLCNRTKGKAKTYKHNHPKLHVVGGDTARVHVLGAYNTKKDLAWTCEIEKHSVMCTYRNNRGRRLFAFLESRGWSRQNKYGTALRPPPEVCRRCPLAMSCALKGVIQF